MSRVDESELGPDRAVPLTALEVEATFYEAATRGRSVYTQLDEGPGVYAAWIVDPAALREAGLKPNAPVALYVGKAITGNGLPHRLAIHTDLPWLELGELLALAWKNGDVLSPFGGRVGLQPGEKRRRQEDPMTTQTLRRTRDWLHESVVWSWITCPASDAARLERKAIHSLRPLLNFDEMPRYPPPLMRAPISTSVRAQWLWHMSWAGVLVGNGSRLGAADRERWHIGQPDATYHADALGYPVADDTHAPGRPAVRRSDCPAGRDLWDFFMDAADDAPGFVRHALGKGMRRDQLCVWWAAHAAAPLLEPPSTAKESVAASFALEAAAGRPGPIKLPSAARCEELSRLAAGLPRFRH